MSDSAPLVSVVTPCYNGEPYLQGYLDGLLSQEYRNIEVVFVDDGSTDRTAEIFEGARELLERRFEGNIVYVEQENKGPCGAFNKAIQYITGEFVAPVDADDVMLPNKIRDHIACFCEYPDAGLVYGDSLLNKAGDEERQERGLRKWKLPPDGTDVYTALLRYGMFIRAGTFCFRKHCLTVLPDERLDETYEGQNLPLLLRISSKYRVAVHNNPVIRLTVRSDSRSREVSRKNLALALRSKRIVEEIVNDIGRTDAIDALIAARYLPQESKYYFLTRNKLEVSRCLVEAVKAGVVSRRMWVHWLAVWTPWTWKWWVRRKYPIWEKELIG